MEQKLDRLQKQTAANTTAAAKARKAEAKVASPTANAAYPVKGAATPSDAVVNMPNNRPTICTADGRTASRLPVASILMAAVTTITPIPLQPYRSGSMTASTSAARASASSASSWATGITP